MWKAPGGAWGIRGLSRGSMRTGFIGEGLLKDLFLDAGVNSYRQPRAICVTHSHTDHVGALGGISTGIETEFPIFSPRGAVGPLRLLLVGEAAAAECTEAPPLRKEDGIPLRFRVKLVGVVEGDEFQLGFGDLRIRIHELKHTVPCVAYLVMQ